MEQEKIKPNHAYRNGVILGIIGTIIGCGIGFFTAAITFLLVALSGGSAAALVLIFAAFVVPGVVILFACVPMFSTRESRGEFGWGAFVASGSTYFVIFVALLTWYSIHDARSKAAYKRATEQTQRERGEDIARLRKPGTLENLSSKLTDREESALRSRLQEKDVSPEALGHVLVTYPELACAVAANENATADQLAIVYESSQCGLDILVAHPHTSERTLREIQDNAKNPYAARARIKLASRLCDVKALREDGEWSTAPANREFQHDLEAVMLKNPCAPMSAFQFFDDVKKGAFLTGRTFPEPQNKPQRFIGLPFEPDYIIRNDGEIFDRMGITYFVQRSCDPGFLSALFHREVGSGNQTGYPFTHFNRSDLDFALANNPCTPEEIINRFHTVMEPYPISLKDWENMTAMRAKARENRTIARAQDWKDPSCEKRDEGMCKEYSEEFRPPTGYKVIGPGYLSGR